MTVGVLLMAYGTPATPDDVEAYYTHIRRGRPPTAEQLAELRGRYEAIGGTSPLLERTRAQASALGATLGERFVVELGMKHARPFIEEGVAALRAVGVERAIGLVLAPHYSTLSVGEYAARARAAAPEVTCVESWWDEPGYLDLLSDRVRDRLERLPSGSEVVFTAHSLPVRVVEMGDPYPDQLRATALAVAERAGLGERWSVAWQSAGRTPEPWLGPDIAEVIDERSTAGAPGLLVCPCGFVSDHLEILYDLDVDAADRAARAGLPFARTAMPNDDPAFIEVLGGVVRAAVVNR